MLRYYVTGGEPHPELEDEKDYLELSYREGEFHARHTSFSDEMECASKERLAQFTAEWMPLFRRNCWLSGCDIEATAAEKAEWIQGFTRAELEAWHLKFLIYPQFENIIQRVAAAFEIKGFEALVEGSNGITFLATKGFLSVSLELTHEGELYRLRVGDEFLGNTSSLYFDTPEDSEEKQWFCYPHPDYNEQMARAFYRLGFDDEYVFTQLHHPLTTHEKMELRLSMPHEL